MTALFTPILMIDQPGSAAILRHDMITPVNHILGYADLLIDDARAKGRVYRAHSLSTIQGLAREATRSIDHYLGIDDPSSAPDLSALGRSLMVPSRSIIEACLALEDASDQVPDRVAFLEDLHRVRSAGERLLKLARELSGPR